MMPRNYLGSTQNYSFYVLLYIMRPWVLCTFCCFLFAKNAHSQTLNFKNDKLKTIFQEIEKKTDWTFNYALEVIDDYSFTGKIDITKPDVFLRKIFYDTPLEFETVRETVLIILPEKKEYRLCGYIKNEAETEPLSFASVAVDGKYQGTQSNEDGYFELKIKAYKNERITVTYLGYTPRTWMVQDWKSENCKNIRLKANSEILGLNIVVKDYMIRGVSEGKTSNSVHLDYSTLRKKNTYEEYDVFKTIQHLPGITSTDETATRLNIRGSTPDQNLVLWEGVSLYDPGHFYGMISSVNPFVINKVDVFKTPSDPSFGSAVGGVIDISLSDEIGDKIHGGIGSSFTQMHAHLSMPIKDKWSFNFAGRSSTNNIVEETPTLNSYFSKVFQLRLEDEETGGNEDSEKGTETEFDFYDLNAKIIYKINDKTRLKSSLFMSRNKFISEALFAEDSIEVREESLFNSSALSIALEKDWRKKWRSKFYITSSGYQNTNINSLGEYGEDDDLYETELIYNNIVDLQFGMQNDISVNENLALQCGYTFEFKVAAYDNEKRNFFGQDAFNFLDFTGNFQNITAFANYQKNNLSIQAGIRNTYYLTLDKMFFSPRINAQYKLHPAFKLKFSTGRFYQFISQVEDLENSGPENNNRLWVINSALTDKPLHADKIALGGVFSKNKWLFDAEVYLNDNKGIRATSALAADEDNFEIIGQSTAIGLDVLLNKSWKNYSLWANYSLSKHTMLFTDIQATRFPADNDRRHNLSVTGNLNFNKWQGTLTWHYRSGLPFSSTPELEEEDDDGEIFYHLEYKQLNDQRQAPYSRVDIALSYKTPVWKEKLNLETRFSIINIFNTENFSPRNYYLADSEDPNSDMPRIVSIDRYLLGLTPQFLLRFYW